jgi:hypothetical protein
VSFVENDLKSRFHALDLGMWRPELYKYFTSRMGSRGRNQAFFRASQKTLFYLLSTVFKPAKSLKSLLVKGFETE